MLVLKLKTMNKEQKTIRIPEGFKAVSFDNNTGEILLEKMPVCITERIKTLKDVLDYHSYTKGDVEFIEKNFQSLSLPHLYFQWLAELIVSVLNEGWEPDLEDDEQDKWVIEYDSEEKGLDLDAYSLYISTPIRLILRDRIMSQHVLDTPEFLDIFKKFMIIEKD